MIDQLPDIEIVYDPVEMAIAQGLLMDDRHEVMPDGEFIQWLQRTVGRDDLFCYHHREVGSFVLAHWLLDPRSYTPRICLEVDVFDGPPDWVYHEGAEFWKYRMVGSREMAQRIHRQIRARQAEQRAVKEDSHAMRQSASRYLKGRGMESSAQMLDAGVPFVGARESAFLGPTDMPEIAKLKGD